MVHSVSTQVTIMATGSGHWFNQPGYKVYQTLESILIKACKSQELESDLETICQFYKEDFDQDLLRTQLQTFAVHFQQVHEGSSDSTTKNVNIFDVKSYLLSLSPAQLSLISKVKHLMQLILVMPASNASSERSFSALRQLKTYLHATMKQDRLNYLRHSSRMSVPSTLCPQGKERSSISLHLLGLNFCGITPTSTGRHF